MIFKAKILQKNRKSLSFRKYNFYKCDQGSDLWKQLELASELESKRNYGLGQEVTC